jgi:serine protease
VITNTEDVDVAAPGFNTTAFVVTDSGTGEDETLSGTSMATPMVAAGVHLARASNPDWGVRETTSTVRDAARPIPNATTQEVGAGMFAVDYAVNDQTPETTQEEAMTDTAATRAEVYDSLSNARGGFLDALTVATPLGVAV